MSDSVWPHRRQPTQAPLSLGFSRQEHWSGLPFPSPMHESEKWKWSRSVMSDPQPPHGLQPSRLLRPWDFPGRSTGVGCHCLLCHKTLDHIYIFKLTVTLLCSDFKTEASSFSRVSCHAFTWRVDSHPLGYLTAPALSTRNLPSKLPNS